MKEAYPIILIPDNNGYTVYIPDLDIGTQGSSIAEAIYMAEDAIGLYGITASDIGKDIPKPSPTLPECKENELTAFAVVDFEAYRRAHDMRTVRKNVTLPSYLNELAEKAGVNFSQILQEGLKKRLNLQ